MLRVHMCRPSNINNISRRSRTRVAVSAAAWGGTHDTSVVLEVQEHTVSALPGLGLADNDGGVDLLAELGLALLDGGHAVRTHAVSSMSPKLVCLLARPILVIANDVCYGAYASGTSSSSWV